jgi:uncharacterized membrane protein
MRILYAGDSKVGGTANYLLGILRWMRIRVTHVPPGKKLSPSLFKKHFDGIILSDFSAKDAPVRSQKMIAGQVARGTGLLMIGGWASFSGPFGGWGGSVVEKLLPVRCSKKDDRIHFPGGAFIVIAKRRFKTGLKQSRTRNLLRLPHFKNPPVICGLNQVQPKKNGIVILSVQKIL